MIRPFTFNSLHLGTILKQKLMEGALRANQKMRRIKPNSPRFETLLVYFRRHNSEFAKKVGYGREKITLSRYQIVCAHLESFIHTEYNAVDLKFSKLNSKVINDFDIYLRQRMNLKPNTVWGYMTVLKHIVSLARNEGLLNSNPFYGYINSGEHVDRGYLFEDELLSLYNAKMPTKAVELVRDLFVFSAYTGISYSDLKRLKKSDVRQMFDGNLWIIFRRKKTNSECPVRLLEIPLEILNKYSLKSKDDHIFTVPCNGHCNELLVKIMELEGIERKITFHAARHTFATLLLSKGVPIETVSRVLGHSDIKTTQIYAKITNEKLSRDMEKVALSLKKNG